MFNALACMSIASDGPLSVLLYSTQAVLPYFTKEEISSKLFLPRETHSKTNIWKPLQRIGLLRRKT